LATLVLTSIGTALGGPLGGALGALVGQSIDQQLFGPGVRRGPRLGDLAVQTSSYGSPIPRIYGTMRVAGTIIWATDLKEGQEIEGGGKSGPEQIRYLYSANLAVALSSRPIREVRRIWADGKLIRGAEGDFKVRTRFRLLTGDEDQIVDPLIASVETLDEAPAYRGLALAVFEEFELAEFGNRIPILTFEVVADEAEVPLAGLLADASDGLIECEDQRPVLGFAAHGSSIGDGLRSLIELAGIKLAERDDRLVTPSAQPVVLLTAAELGCDSDGQNRPAIEQMRTSGSERPVALSLTYYDRDRDYLAGQARSSGGASGSRDERIELPAVLTAVQARQLVEEEFARRWRSGDRPKLRLPPSRMDIRPGNAIQLADSMRAWVVRSVSIEGMAIAVDAEAAPVTIPVLPAAPGRAVAEPDVPVGRTDLALFELPALGDAPDALAKAYVMASNAGLWKPAQVELATGAAPLGIMSLTRRAMLGRAESVLDARAPIVLDNISTVVVSLYNPAQYLLNADDDALMSGANLAMIGDELLQFGRADQLSAGVYRLTKLLRGRRGTEWAALVHAVGDRFCMIDAAVMRTIEQPASAVAATLTATAHGIADSAPLPSAVRTVSGESLRPPSPCHFDLRCDGSNLLANWTRRSHRGWNWTDGVGIADDPFPELYRLIISGPDGEQIAESVTTSVAFDIAQLPGGPGEEITVAVAMIGPAALSHPVVGTITI
jgi:hypothetical protein